MSAKKKIQERILNQPSYWVEAVNGHLYDAILNYMETHDLNRTKLAQHLDISKGRISQILNDGEINFSIEKVIQIALKVGVFPDFKFIDKAEYFTEKEKERKAQLSLSYDLHGLTSLKPKTRQRFAASTLIRSGKQDKIALGYAR